MPAGLARGRGRGRLRPPPIRGVTITGGVALGGVIVLVMALVGGLGPVAEPPLLETEADQERFGPLTALQPELRSALLADQDLPDAPPSADPSGPTVPVATPTVPAPPAGPDEPPADQQWCRTLFEDPAGVPALWPATAPATVPKETTSRHTSRRGGAVLRQVLSVFDDQDAPTAYGHLRETAAECDEFPATLDDAPVTVVLRELAPAPADRRESAVAGDQLADESYALEITVHREAAGALTGWLALDRLGPAISVLHHLGPEGAPPDDPAQTRRSAMGKLRPVLRLLDR